MKLPIILAPYDSNWIAYFKAEREAMERTDQGWFAAIHHIGSTSIPGIAAKPVIDILVELEGDESACAEAMRELDYEYRADGGISGRHYYRKGVPRTHHVHMWEKGHSHIGRHLRFRDYLRSHPEEARAYEILKRELTTHFVSDTLSYANAKTEFCERIDKLSRRPGQTGIVWL